MQNLIGILDSFHRKGTDKPHIKVLVNIIRDLVVPTYPSLEVSIEENRARFSPGWQEIFSALKEALIFEHFVPAQYGGKNSSEEEIYLMMELFGYGSPGLGVIFVSYGRAIDIILHGNEEQKGKFLPRMAKGELGAIAMTEERAGSDASAIGLMARRDGEAFVLNGEKVFISNSGLAQVYTILARTREEKGPRSLSTLVIEDGTKGFTIKDLPKKEGLRVLPTGRLIFKDAVVPNSNLVGEEGKGLLLALDVIDRGRIHIAGICCGLAYRIFREIYRFAFRRRQFDHPLTSSQDISFQIADMYCEMNAARGLCFHALNQVGSPYYRLSSSQAKLFATRAVMYIASRAQVLMGGRGYLRNSLINQLCADARGMEYLEGTSNVQKMIMGRDLFRMYHKETNALGGGKNGGLG